MKKEKKEQTKAKIKIDKSKIASKIMAVFLLVLMIEIHQLFLEANGNK